MLGKEHPDTLRSVNNLASLYQDQGGCPEAEALYKRALEASERVLGKEHPNTFQIVNNLATLYKAQGRYPEAEALYMLKRILHDWDDAGSRQILAACRRNMPAQATLIVLDAVVPTGNDPSFTKLQDLHMLVYSGGRERTEAEHRSVLEAAEFDFVRVVPASPHISIMRLDRYLNERVFACQPDGLI